MKKIIIIENHNHLNKNDLNKIYGGDTVHSCGAGAVLKCTPFKGSCLTVIIDTEKFICSDDAKLVKGTCKSINVLCDENDYNIEIINY